jgi:chromodomain-helicase-DNA-binding protein 4
LVVVPNSTITNWVRELERWAPRLKIVPFFGDARARKCIIEYELTTFHVVVASYEAFSVGPDFNRVFKKQPRWEVLVVDEGQRLKNNESLTFKKLNELKIMHRVIMTGVRLLVVFIDVTDADTAYVQTPLNNNIRELFNLMNFLDPGSWADLQALEIEYQNLTEEPLKRLHERLRPYFLRRTKKEVLKLPPKNEVIVPVSMAPLQKGVYKSVLLGNFDLLRKLGKDSRLSTSLASLKNMLMQLRKCLQHPYLVSPDIEPQGLAERDAHERLVEASAKLSFLRLLLPQLKARGHRVLLFSQFVIALDVIEDYARGEGIKYLRLDGSTAQRARQEGIDEFNREGSEVFLYMLTTRAGGAGINLWTADTVISVCSGSGCRALNTNNAL